MKSQVTGRKGRKEDSDLPTCPPHLCAREDHGTVPPSSCAKAHWEQGGDSRQPAHLASLNSDFMNGYAYKKYTKEPL